MKPWHHAPVHQLSDAGGYMVTAGTYGKAHYFQDPKRLTLLRDLLLSLAKEYRWRLEAWAILSNHYHFIAIALENAMPLNRLIQHLHSVSAIEINRMDGTPGRKIWHSFWDSHITYERSYLARLHYVHQNPVKHGLVSVAEKYPWCSAHWFEQTADLAFYQTVTGFPTDRMNINDDF